VWFDVVNISTESYIIFASVYCGRTVGRVSSARST